MRGTSTYDVGVQRHSTISIHVPLAGNVRGSGIDTTSQRISIHVPLAGNVYIGQQTPHGIIGFLSTFPLRGTSTWYQLTPVRIAISIHVPLAGNVSPTLSLSSVRVTFLSTFPLRGTSGASQIYRLLCSDFYPRSPCGERRGRPGPPLPAQGFLSTFPLRGTSILGTGDRITRDISIHVPLAGNVHHLYAYDLRCPIFLSTFPLRGTSNTGLVTYEMFDISIHVPLAGNVSYCLYYTLDRQGFLSTFPLRGTSLRFSPRRYNQSNFYPRSPCGERLWACRYVPCIHSISIHVPLAGNVAILVAGGIGMVGFLSTFPLRGTSALSRRAGGARLISIHVPLAGNVSRSGASAGSPRDFYPRSPCGERLSGAPQRAGKAIFLSTFPLRGTSSSPPAGGAGGGISIHVPLAGNVTWASPSYMPWQNFYPRSPCGERLKRAARACRLPQFLSTFPLRGTSRRSLASHPDWRNFYPRSPCGERRRASCTAGCPLIISIHVPLAGNVSAFEACRRGAPHFYPRSPCGERRLCNDALDYRESHFYPRSPCGERLDGVDAYLVDAGFLSTFPLRGTSTAVPSPVPISGFLSTFPLRGTS